MMFRLSPFAFRRVFSPCLAKNMANSAQQDVLCVEPVPNISGERHQLVEGSTIPFARAKIGSFFQQNPSLGNQYLEDVTLVSYLKRVLPQEVLHEITPDLIQFGKRVATEIMQLGIECEKYPPKLEHYDAWGKRVDNLITCEAWKKQKVVSAEEGLIAIAYDRKYGQWSRVYQMVKMFLYCPSSGLYGCPLAMTDGAAKIMETLGNINPDIKDRASSHLLSRNPDVFWTSGQWMTERKGGSDVASGTETLAVPQSDGSYRLYGYKWFSSATDSDMALVLGRIVDENGQSTPGSRGLTMFYLETRDEKGDLNGIEVQKLKDKLGTRELPTAELLLDGTKAYRLSEEGRGVAAISYMLNITRLHNTISSASGMRRMMHLSRDYSHKRTVFGKRIKDHVLHIKNLSNMEVETRAGMLLALEIARLLGKEDCGLASDHEQLLYRLLTPLGKLYTAKQAVAVASEGLESFGGMGYLEDTGLPRMLRNAQVLPIWEGTTNVLALDVLRSMAKTDGQVLQAFQKEVYNRTKTAASHPELGDCCRKLQQAADHNIKFPNSNFDKLEMAAREYAFSLARIYMGVLLVEHAAWVEATEQDILVAKRWCQKDLTPMLSELAAGSYTSDTSSLESSLVMDGYHPSSKL